jgi:hypothetical protein
MIQAQQFAHDFVTAWELKAPDSGVFLKIAFI